MADADDTAPAVPSTAAFAASVFKSTNLGNATAAKMPKMTITITNSISVKPCCFCFIVVTL